VKDLKVDFTRFMSVAYQPISDPQFQMSNANNGHWKSPIEKPKHSQDRCITDEGPDGDGGWVGVQLAI